MYRMTMYGVKSFWNKPAKLQNKRLPVAYFSPQPKTHTHHNRGNTSFLAQKREKIDRPGKRSVFVRVGNDSVVSYSCSVFVR